MSTSGMCDTAGRSINNTTRVHLAAVRRVRTGVRGERCAPVRTVRVRRTTSCRSGKTGKGTEPTLRCIMEGNSCVTFARTTPPPSLPPPRVRVVAPPAADVQPGPRSTIVIFQSALGRRTTVSVVRTRSPGRPLFSLGFRSGHQTTGKGRKGAHRIHSAFERVSRQFIRFCFFVDVFFFIIFYSLFVVARAVVNVVVGPTAATTHHGNGHPSPLPPCLFTNDG